MEHDDLGAAVRTVPVLGSILTEPPPEAQVRFSGSISMLMAL